MGEMTNTPNSVESDISKCNSIPYTCNIKQIRQALGLTQSDLARECGYTSNWINMIEHEKDYPILETRIKIAKALSRIAKQHIDTSAIWILKEDQK